MKSEERHKLQHNELADYLGKLVEQIKPYQNTIMGGIILLLAIYIFYTWWSGENAKKVAAANAQFQNAFGVSVLGVPFGSGEPSELLDVEKEYPGTKLGILAQIAAADIHLINGCNQLFKNKVKANAELGQAADLYQKVLQSPLDNPFTIAQAKFGLAKTKECQNDLAAAEKLYGEIVQLQRDGLYELLAAQRLEDLKRTSTKQLCDKFASFDPKAFKDDTLPLSPGKPSLFGPNNREPFAEGPLYEPGSFGEKAGIKTEKSNDIKLNDLLPEKPASGINYPPADSSKPAVDEKPIAGEPSPGSELPATTLPNTPAPETPSPEKTPVPTDEGK